MPIGTGTWTVRDQNVLGRYTARGSLRYKNENAYYCSACYATINVRCPVCKFDSEDRHGEKTFIPVYLVYEIWDGFRWLQVECPKCDYRFRVIIR